MFGGAKKGAQNEAVHHYVDLILEMSVDDGVDKIVFGEPSDGLPRETCKRGDLLKAFLPAEMTEEIERTRDVPIWRRINGAWYDLPGFPWYLLHEIVRDLGDRIVARQTDEQRKQTGSVESIVPLKTKHGNVKVPMTLALEPNYCYSVTLKKID